MHANTLPLHLEFKIQVNSPFRTWNHRHDHPASESEECGPQAAQGMVVIIQCNDTRDNLVIRFSDKDPSSHEHSSILMEELTRMHEDEMGEEMQIGEVCAMNHMYVCALRNIHEMWNISDICMCVCVCACVCVHIHIHICMYVRMHARIYASIYMCVAVLIYVCMYVYTQKKTYVHLHSCMPFIMKSRT
jgi:hypothetical protein